MQFTLSSAALLSTILAFASATVIPEAPATHVPGTLTGVPDIGGKPLVRAAAPEAAAMAIALPEPEPELHSSYVVKRDNAATNPFGGNANIFQRDGYDCAGSAICGSLANLKRDCDRAVNDHIIRNDDLNYGAPGNRAPYTGGCSGHCGVFLQGPATCTMTGNQIWYAYQDIREKGGCQICGNKDYDNGCRLTINQIGSC